MSTPRQPSRIPEYLEGGKYYPRELVETDGKLYMIDDDGSSKIHLNPSSVANAENADHATSADTATEAGHADTADEAGHATTADTATNAGHATTADTATKATTADSATKATTADKATNANKAAEADHATIADEATHATNADEAIHAANADSANKATKLATGRTITIAGETDDVEGFNILGTLFDGTADGVIRIIAMPATIINGLATVATSGNYNDLTNKPTIPTIPSITIANASGSGNAITALSANGHTITPTKGSTFALKSEIPTIPDVEIETSGSGNVISALSADGHTITATKGITALTSHQTIPSITIATATGTGNAITALSSSGHTITPAKGSTFALKSEIPDIPDVSIGTASGSGNVITSLSASGHTITPTKGITALTSHPTISKSTDAESSDAPGYGGTFTTIDSVTRDSNGHVTKINTKTVTMPAAQTSVTGNAGTATKLAASVNIGLSGVTATAQSFDGSKAITIPVTAVPASLLTGTIDIERLPQAALERLVIVADDTARLALTSSSVQNGDVVKVTGTGLMYYVKDDSKLGTADAFEQFTAGTASSVTWSGITGKPTFATVATSGSYNDLSNKPTIPTIPNISIGSASGSGNVITALSASGHTITPTKGITALTAHPTISKSTDSTSTDAPGYGGTFTTIDSVTRDSNGHVTKINTKTVTMPAAQNIPTIPDVEIETSGSGNVITALSADGHTITATKGITALTSHQTIPSITINSASGSGNVITALSASNHAITPTKGITALTGISASTSGSGNVVSAVSASGSKITVTKGVTALTAHPTISVDDDTATTASPAHGKTFTAISGVTRDGNGHVTSIETKTVTLPSETAVTATSSGTGNAVTALSATGHAITYTKGSTFALKSEIPTIPNVSIAAASGSGNAITALSASGHTITPTKGSTFALKSEIPTIPNISIGSASGTGNVITALSASGHTITPTKGITALTSVPDISVSTSGSGNVVSAISASGHALTVTKGVTALTAHQAIPNITIANASGTGNVITALSASGHTITPTKGITALTSHQTIPSITIANASGSGNAITALSASGHTITPTKGNSFLPLSGGNMSGNIVMTSSNPYVKLIDSAYDNQTYYVQGYQGKAALGSTFTKSLQVDNNGNVTIPGSLTVGSYSGLPSITIANASGSGNAITALSASGHTITPTKGSKFLTAHPSVSKSTDSTSTASPAHGGTFTAVDSITRDTYGHVTKINTKTITLPAVSGATTVTYTATIGTSWSGSEPSTQSVTVSGMLATDNPIVDVVLSDDYETAQTQLTDYGKIYRITTAANKITVYANEATENSLTIQLKCIR